MTATALIVDDEVDLCRLMQITLTKMGIKSDVAYDITTAYNLLANNRYDFCLTDMRLPDGSGLDLVKYINQQQDWNMPVAVITAHGNMDIAIEALKLGAFDFVNKPLELPRLKKLVENALKVAQEAIESAEGISIKEKSPTQKLLDERLIGESIAMQKLKATITKLARSQAPVFLWGASGTGKEVVAKLIHDLGPRREGSFVAVNCGAIPSELMESEFFGHKKGSFTGATTDKQGLFQQANGGTLFLDEVADLPLAMQVKLLRAIQEKTIRAIGDTKEVPVDVRILSATHKDLNKLVQQGSFRQDLFYRINVIELQLPTLNQRSEDVPMLAEHFLKLIADDWQLDEELSLSAEALRALQHYEFEGNVRELRNLLERAITMADSNIIDSQHLNLKANTAGKPATESVAITDSKSESNPVGYQTTKAHFITSYLPNSLAKSAAKTTQQPASIKTDEQASLANKNNTGKLTNQFNNHRGSHRESHKEADTSAQDMVSSTIATNTVVTDRNTTDTVTTTNQPNVLVNQDLASQLLAGLDSDTGLPVDGLEKFLQKQERVLLMNALKQTNGNKTKTAKLLDMSLRSLRYRLDKLNVESSEDKN